MRRKGTKDTQEGPWGEKAYYTMEGRPASTTTGGHGGPPLRKAPHTEAP